MVELEFKIELSDYMQLLSDWLKREWNVFLQFIGRLSIQLFVFMKNQYQFLRKFKYSKENIKEHLMQKAALFFGIELNEKERKNKRRNKPFKSRLRLNTKQSNHKNKVALVKVNTKLNKKLKNNRINLYRAPE
ncbi:MAG: hypothetical protein GQ574_13010 [Crocinitomix sp.]|nr:hypothetical protein [Crocinitomix sp.]